MFQLQRRSCASQPLVRHLVVQLRCGFELAAFIQFSVPPFANVGPGGHSPGIENYSLRPPQSPGNNSSASVYLEAGFSLSYNMRLPAWRKPEAMEGNTFGSWMHSGRMILLFVVIALNQDGSMASTSRPASLFMFTSQPRQFQASSRVSY